MTTVALCKYFIHISHCSSRKRLNEAFHFSKKRLFGQWQKTENPRNSAATLVLHNTLKAFKFPDEAQVYLKCDIEVSIITATR